MEDFVNFELAKKLKEKGFDEACYNYYEPLKHCLSELKTQFTNKEGEYYGIITAPTISQVLKWLRDEKGIHVCIALGEFSDWMYDVSRIDGNMFCKAEDDFKSYEQAVLAGIEYTIDNLI